MLYIARHFENPSKSFVESFAEFTDYVAVCLGHVSSLNISPLFLWSEPPFYSLPSSHSLDASLDLDYLHLILELNHDPDT